MSDWTDNERAAMLQWTMEEILENAKDHGGELSIDWVINRIEAALDECLSRSLGE